MLTPPAQANANCALAAAERRTCTIGKRERGFRSRGVPRAQEWELRSGFAHKTGSLQKATAKRGAVAPGVIRKSAKGQELRRGAVAPGVIRKNVKGQEREGCGEE